MSEEQGSMRHMTDEEKFELCARIAHEANRAYCIAVGDDSTMPWEYAPEWQQETVRKGVHGVLVDRNNPKQSHESWLREKNREGWRYGPVKDPDKKEHPCFLPYDELAPEQKCKDSIFVNVVQAVFAALP